MAKGEIILITFPFTDLSGTKLRPAVVLVESLLDLTVCFITTNTELETPTDLLLYPTSRNGIKKRIINSHKQNCNITQRLKQRNYW